MQTRAAPALPQDRRAPLSGRKCSFCDKPNEQIERLIAGPGGVHICSECVEFFNGMIGEHRAKDAAR